MYNWHSRRIFRDVSQDVSRDVSLALHSYVIAITSLLTTAYLLDFSMEEPLKRLRSQEKNIDGYC